MAKSGIIKQTLKQTREKRKLKTSETCLNKGSEGLKESMRFG